LTSLSRFKGPLPMSNVKGFDQTREFLASQDPQKVIITGGGIIEPRAMSCMNRAFEVAKGLNHIALKAFAISVEPGVTFGFRARRTLAKQLEHLGPVAVRDDLSARVLRELAPKHNVRTVGDIALWSHPSSLPAELEDMGQQPGIVVILQTTWAKEDIFPWLTKELVTLARLKKLPITVLPFSVLKDKDMTIHQSLVEALRETAPDLVVNAPAEKLPADELTHGVAAALLGKAALCISTRLHGCVTAFSQRTPFVALAYHPKLKGFAETINCQHALLPSHPPAKQATGTYGYQFADLGLRSGDLVQKSEEMLEHTDFSAIEFYRRRQQETLAQFLAS